MKKGLWDKLSRVWKMATTMDILEAIYAESNAKSGEHVNWKTALETSTSLACSRVIAESIAQIPFKLMQTDGRERKPVTGDPLYYLLHDSPNEFMTSYDYRETIGLHLVLCGNHFSFINRDMNGNIVELLPWEPGMVTVTRDKWTSAYTVTPDNGQPFPVPAANMWHIKGPSWNGWMGLEGVKLAREAIGLALATEEHGSLLFKNGAQGSGLLSTDQPLSVEKARELRDSWQSTYSGVNRFKTAVLWGGMKWTPMSIPNDNSQFLETRKFQVEEICRSFRIMPIMVGYSDKTATYASAEQMFLAHVVYSMGPWYSRIEESANKNLLTPEQRRDGYYFKFFVNGLLRGAAKDRAEFYKTMSEIRALKPNEIRELEDMNPYDGGDEFPVLQGQAVKEEKPETVE